MGLPALDLDAGRALAIACPSELCDRHGLVELGHGPEHLPDQPRRRGILDEGVRLSAAISSMPRSLSIA